MFTFYKTPVFIGVSAVNIAVNIVNIAMNIDDAPASRVLLHRVS